MVSLGWAFCYLFDWIRWWSFEAMQQRLWPSNIYDVLSYINHWFNHSICDTDSRIKSSHLLNCPWLLFALLICWWHFSRYFSAAFVMRSGHCEWPTIAGEQFSKEMISFMIKINLPIRRGWWAAFFSECLMNSLIGNRSSSHLTINLIHTAVNLIWLLPLNLWRFSEEKRVSFGMFASKRLGILIQSHQKAVNNADCCRYWITFLVANDVWSTGTDLINIWWYKIWNLNGFFRTLKIILLWILRGQTFASEIWEPNLWFSLNNWCWSHELLKCGGSHQNDQFSHSIPPSGHRIEWLGAKREKIKSENPRIENPERWEKILRSREFFLDILHRSQMEMYKKMFIRNID